MTDISSVPSLKQSTNAKQPTKKQGYSIDHTILSLSLSLSLTKTHFNYSYGCVVFFSYSTQRQFYSVYFLSRFCCLFRHFIGHFLSNISLSLSYILSLTLFLKHTCTYYYNVLVASIDYNNNCIYIYKPLFFASTHTHTHISISTLKIYRSRIYHRHLS